MYKLLEKTAAQRNQHLSPELLPHNYKTMLRVKLFATLPFIQLVKTFIAYPLCTRQALC